MSEPNESPLDAALRALIMCDHRNAVRRACKDSADILSCPACGAYRFVTSPEFAWYLPHLVLSVRTIMLDALGGET